MIEFEYLPLEKFSENLTDLILELIEDNGADFDKNEVHLFEDPCHKYGLIGIKFFNDTSKQLNFVQRVYFPVCDN